MNQPKTPSNNPVMNFIKWWLTPVVTERDTRFREGVIRVTTFSLISILTLAIIALFPFLVGDTEAQIGRMLTMMTFIVLLFVPFFLVQRGYIITAGWTLLAMPTFGFITLSLSLGIWLNISLFFLILVSLYGQVVLPRRQIRYLFILSFGLVLFVQFFAIPKVVLSVSPAEILPQLLTRSIASIITVVILIAINVLLYVLRQEFDSRQEELQSFVTELDNRVKDRTKELEVAKQQAEDARQQAEDANQIKSQFLANMSHELRTPLNAILNFTAFVADGVMGDVNEEQEDALRQSISSGKHLLALINDILDVTKIEAGLMDLFIQPVDLSEVINGAVSIGKGLAKDKPVQLIVEVQEKLPTTYGDKRRLRQVFLNVISNAFKFTKEGSVTIYADSTDTHLNVRVTDTGIGIAPENYDMVFESFKQVKNDNLEVVGTGLGMPISKYFVESHQGKMWFESQVGVGTTFFIQLPILTEEQANTL